MMHEIKKILSNLVKHIADGVAWQQMTLTESTSQNIDYILHIYIILSVNIDYIFAYILTIHC